MKFSDEERWAVAEKVRNALKEYKMQVRELADCIDEDCSLVDNVTGFDMLDVYEEDNGLLVLSGYENVPKVPRRGMNKHEPEVIAFIKENARLRTTELRKVTNQKFGTTFTQAAISMIAQKNGFHIGSETKWTKEMDDFIRKTVEKPCTEVSKEMMTMFGVYVSPASVSDRRKTLKCALKRAKWTYEINNFILGANAPNSRVLHEAINKKFGTNFSWAAVCCHLSGMGVRLERC